MIKDKRKHTGSHLFFFAMMVAACIDFPKYYCRSFRIGLSEAVRIFYTWTIIFLTRDYPNLISLNYYSVLWGYEYDGCAVLNCGPNVIAETGCITE